MPRLVGLSSLLRLDAIIKVELRLQFTRDVKNIGFEFHKFALASFYFLNIFPNPRASTWHKSHRCIINIMALSWRNTF